MTLSLIVAADEADTIGNAGGLPWDLPADLRRFRALTLGHTVVMGRVTHEGILARLGRPLPGRTTLVLTSDDSQPTGPGVFCMDLRHTAADVVAAMWPGEEVFVAGGAGVYAQLLPSVQRVYLTRVGGTHMGDRRMPAGWLDGFVLCRRVRHEGSGGYAFEVWRRATPRDS